MRRKKFARWRKPAAVVLVSAAIAVSNAAFAQTSEQLKGLKSDLWRDVIASYQQGITAAGSGDMQKANAAFQFVLKNLDTARVLPPIERVRIACAKEMTRSEIDAKYAEANEKSARGDYSVSEEIFDTINRNHWARDRYPSRVEAELMYATLVLRKGNRKAEGESVVAKYLPLAEKSEAELKANIERKKKAYDGTHKNSFEEHNARLDLSYARRELANLYFAEGKYADADVLLNAAFVDAGTAGGRQCTQALRIGKDIERFLSATGRSPEAGKKLVSIKNGHPPVKIELHPSAGFKTSGAEKLFAIFDDQFGVKTNGEWTTKQAWLQGTTGDRVVWRKQIPLHTIVNMDNIRIDAKGQFIQISSNYNMYDGNPTVRQKFLWDGKSVQFKGSN